MPLQALSHEGVNQHRGGVDADAKQRNQVIVSARRKHLFVTHHHMPRAAVIPALTDERRRQSMPLTHRNNTLSEHKEESACCREIFGGEKFISTITMPKRGFERAKPIASVIVKRVLLDT